MIEKPASHIDEETSVIAGADGDPLRAWHFRQLRWALQGLASAGSSQRTLFPDSELKADELAFDFDRAVFLIRGEYEADLSPAQSDALQAIGRKLKTISRDGAEFDLELWTDAALRTSEHWADVRALAASALAAFGWPESAAPPQGN